MSEINKKARIEYLQELYRSSESDRQSLRAALEEILKIGGPIVARLAREALSLSSRQPARSQRRGDEANG